MRPRGDGGGEAGGCGGVEVSGDSCASCRTPVTGSAYFTEVNPEGGYGMSRALVCDPCMASDHWADWRARKWVNWPDMPRVLGD
jgi:hypothetical protein